MKEDGFYAVYGETSNKVIYFHNLPLEKVDEKKEKVVFTCKGISYIEVKDNLKKYEGKEKEYVVIDGKLQRRSRNEIEAEKLQHQLSDIKNEIARKISSQITIEKELKIVKGYLDWVKEGQPEDDYREKEYLEMQHTIDNIKSEYVDKKEIIIEKTNKLKY